MSRPPRSVRERVITAVTPVAGKFLMIEWDRTQMGLVDMRPMLESLSAFEFLKDSDAFKGVKIAEDGSAVVWIDYEGDEIDIDSAALWVRRRPIAATPPKSAIDSAVNLVNA